MSKYSYNDGNVTSSEYLNPLIFQKGIQTISIKINNYKNNLSPEYLKGVKLSLYYSENGDDGDLVLIKDYILKPYDEVQQSIFETWTFDANIDYSIENPLEFANDLTKEDLKKLQKDVIDKYNEVYSIINSGNSEEYSKLYQNSFKRETSSMYLNSTESKKYVEDLKNRVISSKGYMKPIENFEININPNNKIIELTSKEGKPMLYSIDDKGKKKFYGLQSLAS